MNKLREIVGKIRYNDPRVSSAADRQAMGDSVWRLSVIAPELLAVVEAARNLTEYDPTTSHAPLRVALKALDAKLTSE